MLGVTLTGSVRKRSKQLLGLLLIGLSGLGILEGQTAQKTLHSQPKVWLGIDTLEHSDFAPLWGKRVGLLTHPAGVNRKGESTIDVLLRSPKVQLRALFGPEHGIYGDEKANAPVTDRIDKRTGLPVFSLYGKFRKPTPDMLRHIDLMVVDLQDIGVRSYTFISCMRYAMEACFEAGIAFMVLDRPNPLGGWKVDGPMLEERWMSYVGAFQVPYVHGFTIGELAIMAKRLPGWLKVSESVRRRGKLLVVPMKGWKRDLLWTDTGLKWTPTSPYIPSLSSVMGYAMTGLGAQIGGFRHGIGSPYPFRLLSYSGKTSEHLKQTLESKGIAGLSYSIASYRTPNGDSRRGVYIGVRDWNRWRPTELSFYMMQLAASWCRENPFAAASSDKADLFNKHVGASDWWVELSRRGSKARTSAFVDTWERENRAFRDRMKQFFIYP